MSLFISLQFYAYIFPKLDLVNMKTDFLNRNVNEGFSGGEKKRNEILQLAVWLSFVVNLLAYVILIKQNFILKKMPSAGCIYSAVTIFVLLEKYSTKILMGCHAFTFL